MRLLTVGIELRALVKETKTLGAGAAADEVAQGTSQDAAVNGGGVTSVGGLVAARELSLVTALSLSLLDGQVIRDREAGTEVARHSGHGGGESEGNGAQSELHCDCGIGFEREIGLGV